MPCRAGIIQALCQVSKVLGQGGAEVPEHLADALKVVTCWAAMYTVASCSECHTHTGATTSAPELVKNSASEP